MTLVHCGREGWTEGLVEGLDGGDGWVEGRAGRRGWMEGRAVWRGWATGALLVLAVLEQRWTHTLVLFFLVRKFKITISLLV